MKHYFIKLFCSFILISVFHVFPSMAQSLKVDNDRFSNLETKHFINKEVAFEGIIKSIKYQKGKAPYIRLSLTGKTKSELWSAFLFKIGKTKGMKRGHKLRIYGFFVPTKKQEEIMYGNKTGFVLLTICYANLSTSEKAYMAEKQCNKWEQG